MTKFICLLSFIFISSCSASVEKRISGEWIFQYILDSEGDLQPYLNNNRIQLRSDYSCYLTKYKIKNIEEYVKSDNEGIWSIKQISAKEYELTIESTNVVFSGTYKMKYYYDSKLGGLYVELIKDDLHFLAGKDNYHLGPDDPFVKEHTFPISDLGKISELLPLAW